MSKKIVFNVSKDGDVRIEHLEGYGSGCLDATKLLERALGKADETSRTMTQEYYDQASATQTEQLHH